jgi:hypothetical protein
MVGSLPLRAIGDVHGHPDHLACAAAGADALVLLGDLIDRGPDSAGALRLGLALVESGRARLVRSNHDDKLFRHFLGRPVSIGPNLRATLAGLEAAPDAADLRAQFMRIYRETPLVIRIGAYVFAHGAVHPHRFRDGAFIEDAEFGADHMALYGEVDGSTHADGRPVRRYGWVDRVPAGVTAIVGHDRRGGEHVHIQAGAEGGRAVFLDTGCGKGGPLSFIDLPQERIGQVPAG